MPQEYGNSAARCPHCGSDISDTHAPIATDPAHQMKMTSHIETIDAQGKVISRKPADAYTEEDDHEVHPYPSNAARQGIVKPAKKLASYL